MLTGARYSLLFGCLLASGLCAAEPQQASASDKAVAADASTQQLNSGGSPADEAQLNQKKSINKIVVVSNAIFDESDPDAFFIHRWANYLHINTRESTILNKLSFNDKDKVSQKDLDEAQRILDRKSVV